MNRHRPLHALQIALFAVPLSTPIVAQPLAAASKPLSLALAAILVAGAALLSSVQAGDAQPLPTAMPPQKIQADFVSGRVLVKFKGTTTRPNDGPVTREAPQGQLMLSAAAQSALASIDGKVTKTFAKLGVNVISTPRTTGAAIEALYRSGTVEYAEPDYRVEAFKTPNDPDFPKLWGLHNTGQTGGTKDADIDAPETWNTRTDASDTIVGVIDTGVDYTHFDLKDNIWSNPREIPDNGIDDDGNGYVDDIHGINAITGAGNPMDDHGHGTHCAGTIGARGNDKMGIAGVAWKAKIMPLKFLGSDGFGTDSGAIEAIFYAIAIKQANGDAHMVLSNSWGGGGYGQSLYNAINIARAQGILFIAAAGNNGADTDPAPEYPAGYDLPNIVSVGASDAKDQPADFSNRGCTSVDLFAPGVEILSTTPGNSYDTWSGTSMATPHVAGAAALIWSQFPKADWQAVKRALLNGADAKPSLTGLAGTGARLNLKGGLSATYMNQPAIWGVTPTTAAPGDAITVTGSNFGTTGTLSFNGQPLTVKSWGAERIAATLPDDLTLGAGLIQVKTAGKQNRNGQCFQISRVAQLAGRTLLPRAWAAGARVGGDYWILGGETSWGQTGLVERYNTARGRSVMDTDWMMPIPATNAGAAAIGDKIYVVGGFDGNTFETLNTLQILDTKKGTWTTGKPVPTRLSQPAVAALADGKLYAFGGNNGSSGVLNSTYIYDPAKNTWSSGAAMPTARAFAVAIAEGASTRAWVLGGYHGPYLGDEDAAAEVYDAATDTWTALPALNHLRGAPAGAYYLGQPYVLGGGDYVTDEWGSYFIDRADGERFDDPAWIIDVPDTQPLRTATGATFDKGIYVFGGYNGLTGHSANIWRIR